MSENKKTIFLSYGRDEHNPQDVELVRKIKKDLGENGFEVLIDKEQLRMGTTWEIKLENMIVKSDMMLFFITPYSARRPNGFCLNELAMSIIQNKPIVPIMLNYTIPPLSICRLQYLDFQKANNDHYEKKLNEIINVINGKYILGFEGEHLTVLSMLNPIKFEHTIAKYSYKFRGRVWVYKEVSKWLKKEDNSRVLFIQAEPGFGKSAIAACLASRHPLALGIYFCQYDYPESKEVREMLKVLIFQLSTQIEAYHEILQAKNIKESLDKSAVHIYTQLLLEPLQQISKPNKKYFFIIDAVDEANSESGNEIVKFISSRFIDLPSWINIVITCRPESELSVKLKRFNPIKLKVDDKRNIEDLEIFLDDVRLIKEKNLRKALISKSEGNMLYLKSILSLEEDGEMTVEDIEKLPAGIEDFYFTYFERKFFDVKLYEEEYLMFVSLLVLLQGLPELLIKDILHISEREYSKIKSRFGSLLKIDNQKLTFYHKTLFEWLSDYERSRDYSADLEMSQKIFSKFMKDLSEDTYKEDYLQYDTFNIILIHTLYKVNNLNKFFTLLEKFDKDKIVTFLNKIIFTIKTAELDGEFIDISIEVCKIFLITLESLDIEKNPKIQELYFLRLNTLGLIYKKKDIQKSIQTYSKELRMLEPLYFNDKVKWQELYIHVLNNAGTSYRANNIENASKNPQIYLKSLERSITLLEKALKTVEPLYKINKIYWSDIYSSTLFNLGFSYVGKSKKSKAIKTFNKVKTILEDSHVTNSDKWLQTLQALNELNRNNKLPNNTNNAIRRNDPCPCKSGKKYKKCCAKS